MDITSMVSQLRAEAKKFSDAADALEKTTTNGSIPVKRTGARKMSKAARDRISQTQKARWAEKRKHTDSGTKKAKTTK